MSEGAVSDFDHTSHIFNTDLLYSLLIF